MTMSKTISISTFIASIALLASCAGTPKPDTTVDAQPSIYPDYAGVTMPVNMAAPVFQLADSAATEAFATFASGEATAEVKGNGCEIAIPLEQWQKLTSASTTVKVTMMGKKDGKWIEYQPFDIYVSPDSIDAYLTYRLIEPGYESWYSMGLYQRCLENYEQTELISNERTDRNCMNCHSYCNRNPEKMLFHMRAQNGGTYMVDGNSITRLDTKTPNTMSALVYPYWHPSGKYVAFSTNDTHQLFHSTDPNRIEVMDHASDVVIFDTERKEVFTSPTLSSPAPMETFPTFSPDGKTLYFCTADSVKMPEGFNSVKYSLCSVSFDAANGKIGENVDTLYSASQGLSASFPRVSPDGKYMLATMSDYGQFTIWHKDADLYLIDIATKEAKPAADINSGDVDSYHSWSSNGRWVVLSSRRDDGLYTRPYIAHFNEDGTFDKPFALPQETADFYRLSMKSFNVPEFATGAVKVTPQSITDCAKGSAQSVKFRP